jgi:hypothetical protein
MKKVPRYSHQVTLAFDVYSADKNGKDITPAMFKAALLARIEDLDRSNEWSDAVWIEDTEEVDDRS